jgi:ribose transport system permease protein
MPSRGTRFRKAIGFNNISAVYVWIVLIIVFSVWKPHQFPTYDTAVLILNGNSITGLVALGLIIPLAAGVFDLSVGYILGSSSVFLALLLSHGWAPVPAIIITICLAVAFGIVNGVIVVGLGIDSFIATLATGSLLEGFMLAITGNSQIIEHVDRVQFLGRENWNQITIPVACMFLVAGLLWYGLSHTAQGRFVYATGQGETAARLSGIATTRIRFFSFLISGLIAGIAGILLTGVIGAGSPSTGPSYLIPAFAAVFLGATQLRNGLWNAWGTVIAVLLLGTVATGLALANVPIWAPFVVNGMVLIIALGLKEAQRRQALRRTGRRQRPSRGGEDSASDEQSPVEGSPQPQQ